MDAGEWLTPAQAAHYLRVSLAWLARRRKPGTGGPVWVKKSTRIVGYWRRDLDEWLKSNRQAA